jgi:GT2 family glycosyltransferase
MFTSVPIIVIGYNRPKAIERLLNSLLKASYPGIVDLIISIDGGKGDWEKGGQGDGETRRRGDKKTGRGGEEVREVAVNFKWPFGTKKLIFHETNMGLRKHVLSCGDLSKDYDGVIVLEDDLYVSPVFYQYTLQAFDYYKDDLKIAGISLYSHAYNETAQFPFRPLTDDSDVFFLQYAASLGQFWSRENWSAFREWYDALEPGDESTGHSTGHLPTNIRLWPETSWKLYHPARSLFRLPAFFTDHSFWG